MSVRYYRGYEEVNSYIGKDYVTLLHGQKEIKIPNGLSTFEIVNELKDEFPSLAERYLLIAQHRDTGYAFFIYASKPNEIILEDIPNIFIPSLPFLLEKLGKERSQEFLRFLPYEEKELRSAFTSKGMYAFVCWKWVRPLSEWLKGKRVLEIMSGRGYLSYALKECGVDVISTDNYSWDEVGTQEESLIKTENLNANEAIEKYGKNMDVVIMSWPDYQDESSYEALKKLHEVNPNAVILYIGEGRNGCTASLNFHKHFKEIEEVNLNEVADKFTRWESVYDTISIGKYSKEEVSMHLPY